MIEQLFSELTDRVEQASIVAIIASFIWGILSVLLSPCHLASIPLVVAFIDGQAIRSTKRAFWLSSLFSIGILITIAAIGLVTSFCGQMLGDIGSWINYIVAVLFLIFGLILIGVLDIPFSAPSTFTIKRKGALAALSMGLVFGLALGPCTFTYMAPMLGVVLRVAAQRPIYSAMLLLFYGIGHCCVIVLAGTFTGMVQKYANWNETSKVTIIIKRICGFLIIISGLYLIYKT